jgi:hypothetical protein
MAEVFAGSTVGAEGFSRRVAIKRVLPGYSDNQQFAQMFIAEAQISSRLVHPNIVSVLDFDRDNEHRLFLVMEIVDGKDLDALLQTGVLPTSVVIHVVAEMLRGLGYAHDLPNTGDTVRGVVHRDVSPHNVLLSWEGAAKVSDFGIAKAREASNATASVFIKGKPAYMSPEQANGEALDGRSDLFAVGIMLWEMLVGRRLFTGGDTRATLAQVLFGQIPKPRGQRSDVPKDIERVCMKLLERAPNDRYHTAEDAIADLMKCSSAPKAGRDELVALMAQRFPAEAPVRHSQRNRSVKEASGPVVAQVMPMAIAAPIVPQTLPATPGAMGAAGAPTVRGRALDYNIAVAPAVETRNAYAETRTAVPASSSMVNVAPGTSRLRWMLPVIIGGVIAIVAVVGAVLASKGGKDSAKSGSNATQAAISNADAAPAVDAVLVATVAVDAPVVVVAPDAGFDAAIIAATVTPDAPLLSPTADAAATPVASAKTKMGSIRVATDPPCEVFVNGHRLGTSPGTFRVNVGRVTVTLSNTERNIRTTVSVTVKEGQTASVDKFF